MRPEQLVPRIAAILKWLTFAGIDPAAIIAARAAQSLGSLPSQDGSLVQGSNPTAIVAARAAQSKGSSPSQNDSGHLHQLSCLLPAHHSCKGKASLTPMTA